MNTFLYIIQEKRTSVKKKLLERLPNLPNREMVVGI